MHVVRKTLADIPATLVTAVVLVMAAAGSANAQDNTRFFQMALWTDASLGNGDIRTFYFTHESQPPQGPTVMIAYDPTYDYAAGNVGGVTIDWSRVAAVEVDEPYGPQADPRIDSVIKYPDGSPACQGDPSAYMVPIDALLQRRATELKGLAPKARFWVNFTTAEANWIGFCATPQEFNRAYIDVVSADWYYADFSVLQPFYSVVAANPPKPDQQVALIPGTFYRSGQDDPATQVRHFQTYFPSANSMNQSCNLPLGDRGVTGYFDGCPVWMVLGWLAPSFTQGSTQYVGLLDSRSASIKQAWDSELALPLAPALANQRTPAQIIQPILQLVLN